MSGRRVIVAVSAAPLLLVGCFTTTADYRDTAETFIVEDADVGDALGVTFVSADCEEPPGQEPGTTFGCTAVDEAGDRWEFDVEISDSNSVVVTQASRS
jgi:hypothetical protein